MDIPFGRPIIGAEERLAVNDVLNSPQLVHGPKAKSFESEFARLLSPKQEAYATSLSSCTAGLHLAYMHLGIGPGDEVIVPAQTHVATAHAVEITGAKPVFVDCDSTTGNIDVTAIPQKITERTKAISVVHYLGLPVEMGSVVQLAQKRNLFVVEDCALALGSSLDGVACGLIGDVGVFSFYPVKHITTGEGGMLVSKHQQVVQSIANIKAFGYDKGLEERKTPGVYDIVRLGLNYRMGEIAAAMGLEQLKKFPGFQEKRLKNASTLRRMLSEISEIKVLADGTPKKVHSNYCLVAVLDGQLGPRRSEIITHMKAQGIGTSVYYPVPIPLSIYYREKYGHQADQFPNALNISNHSIALPVGPHLNEKDMENVAKGLMAAIQEVKHK